MSRVGAEVLCGPELLESGATMGCLLVYTVPGEEPAKGLQPLATLPTEVHQGGLPALP